jgi:putative FmdB family regulatory protein
MPLYLFKCPNCQSILEKICRFSESDMQECPECKSTLLRQPTAPGTFKFKGVKSTDTM